MQKKIIAFFGGALLLGCTVGNDATGESASSAASSLDGAFQYTREYIFLGAGLETPMVAPFTFESVDLGEELRRTLRARLARGPVWDRFVEETSRTSRAGGVWRVVPDGDLSVLAGGATEVETLRFERADRRLRLDLGRPTSRWNSVGEGDDTRFRMLDGYLSIGTEAVTGPVFEILRVDRLQADGWPLARTLDAIFLTSVDSVEIMVSSERDDAGIVESYAWIEGPGGGRSYPSSQIDWVDQRIFEDARRDIPSTWRFRVPGAQITGEVTASGFDAVLGPERAGRRSVDLRFTVAGWVEIGGERRDVNGMVQHQQ